ITSHSTGWNRPRRSHIASPVENILRSLLSRIQSDLRLGYTMSSSWRTSIYSDKIATMELRCACLAYADDTIWIGKNKQDLERIIEISNEFFDLNDIAINGKKSELIIINPSVP